MDEDRPSHTAKDGDWVAEAQGTGEDTTSPRRDVPVDLRDTHENAAPGVAHETSVEKVHGMFDREGSGPYAAHGPDSRIVDERPYFERGQVGPYVSGNLPELTPERAPLSSGGSAEEISRDPTRSRVADRDAAAGRQPSGEPDATTEAVAGPDASDEGPYRDRPGAGAWSSG